MGRIHATKIVPPQTPAFALARNHLLRLLGETHAPVTLVVAPPGYGKTVLLAQWARRQPEGSVAWLSIDRADDDPRRFAAHLCASLAATVPGLGESALAHVEQRAGGLGDLFLTELLDEILAMPPCTIVLDDVDTVSNVALLADIAMFIEQASPHVRFVVSMRSDAQLGLAHLRLRDEVVEVREHDLAFDRAETKQLLERLSHRHLTQDHVDALANRTEGWPAAVQMAAVALRDAADVDEAIARFTGNDQHIASYLVDEVLAQQPEDVKQFLLQTSPLERLSGALCNAVTGGDNGHQMLARFERESLFVVRIDEYGEWFRYRRLFRDLLRYHLRAAGQDEGELLRRAARWHFDHDDVESGAYYLTAAQNWAGVLSLVTEQSRSLFERGDAGAALRWLDGVPERVRSRRRETLFEHAVLATMTGNTLRADEDLRRAEAEQALTSGEQAVADMLRAIWVESHASPDAVIEASNRVLRVLDTGDLTGTPNIYQFGTPEHLRATTLISRARAFHYRGETAKARTELLRLVSDPNLYAAWMVNALGSLALVEAWTGHLRRAEEYAARALRIAAEMGFDGHPATSDAHIALACVLRERNLLPRAALVLAEAEAIEHRTLRSVPLAAHAGEAALHHLACGAPRAGLQGLMRLRQQGGAPPPSRIAARLRAIEARLLMAMGEHSRAASVLDDDKAIVTTELAAARVQLAVAHDDVPMARKLLDGWSSTIDEHDLQAQLESGIWAAVVQHVDHDARRARNAMADVVATAEAEGHVRLFLDAGPKARRVLFSVFESAPTRYLEALVQQEAPLAQQPRQHEGHLVDPLSDRETVVLRWLPTRLSNAEIAGQLYISLNTLKTHLRHIYQKIGATNRREAVDIAESLDLL
jgi:LuxR family maltose regulon positive regulatory protein